jgi:hypothetical protein
MLKIIWLALLWQQIGGLKWVHFCFSVNLMASMGTLAAIAKQRPHFMSLVVEAFESLHGKMNGRDNYTTKCCI